MTDANKSLKGVHFSILYINSW